MPKTETHHKHITSTARAAIMFTLALCWLLALASLLPHGGISEDISQLVLANPWLFWFLVIGWFVIIAEGLWGFLESPDKIKNSLLRLLLVILIPPFRLAIAPAIPNRSIWLPRYGWQRTGQALMDITDARLALPMLLITLLILPVIGGEFAFSEQIEASPALALLQHFVTATIWFAFAFEFILMVSIAERKLDYCKKHWINIVIILLPLIAFLRTLQLFRFLRVAKAGKLLRAYRLRGVMARALRLALVFNLLERIMARRPEKYLAHLQEKIQEKETELGELRDKLAQLQAKMNNNHSD